MSPAFREKLLSALANPNLAYILMMIGLAGLYFELSHPGTIFPGVVGAVSLILAFFGMSALPVSYAGLALIGLAIVLFIAEIKIASYGMLSVGGSIALILGSIMLFENEGEFTAVSLTVMVPTLLVVMLFFGTLAYLAGKAQLKQSDTGQEGLMGETAVVVDAARVMVMGELWNAEGLDGLARGDMVRIVKTQGLKLTVEPLRDKPVDPPKGEEV
jgi:membrane-bound serine protease (ClpP class)